MTIIVRVIMSGVLVGESVRVGESVAVAGRTDVLVALRVPDGVRDMVTLRVGDAVSVIVGYLGMVAVILAGSRVLVAALVLVRLAVTVRLKVGVGERDPATTVSVAPRCSGDVAF